MGAAIRRPHINKKNMEGKKTKEKAPKKSKTYKMEPLKDCAEVTILKNFGRFKKGQKRRMHDSMVDLLKSKGVI